MKIAARQKLSNSVAKRLRAFDHRLGARFLRAAGVSGRPGEPELVVSLTTIAERVPTVHLTLDSLLRQTLRPDRLVLWLNRTEVPGRPLLTPETLPRSLTRLVSRGLTIEWCENIGPYCKLIPSLRRFPPARIATADDDILYPANWLETLVQAQRREPQYLHCHRAHLMRYGADGALRPYAEWPRQAGAETGPSYELFPTGVGGVLYAPGDLAPEVLDESAFRTLCPRADDVWFKAMSLLAGKQCRVVPGRVFRERQCELPTARRHNLRAFNVGAGGNDAQLRAVAARYPVFHRGAVVPAPAVAHGGFAP
jgi:hypothetical protein